METKSEDELYNEYIMNVILQRHKDYDESLKNGEHIYLSYCVWCNAFNNFKGKNDAKTFARFLISTNTKLNFWQKKHLAEKYFNYKYNYDYDNKKWNISKVK